MWHPGWCQWSSSSSVAMAIDMQKASEKRRLKLCRVAVVYITAPVPSDYLSICSQATRLLEMVMVFITMYKKY